MDPLVRILSRPRRLGLPLLALAILGGIIVSLLFVRDLVGSTPSGQILGLAAYPPAHLASPEQHGNGLLLLPPPQGAQPTVGAWEAVAVANQDGVSGAASVQTLLATYEDPNLQTSTLVWVVRYSGVCAPIIAPVHESPICAHQDWNVMVDATSGQIIASFTP
jgi:hypothetical protein